MNTLLYKNRDYVFGRDVAQCWEISDPAVISREPLVSIHMITYNHEHYISQAIEGILRQETDFPIELVIGEDRSTDRTRDIVLDYQRKWPGMIRVITSDNNVGASENSRRTTAACRGRYVAFCEGDDYWHSPHKLQKQIRILEKDSAVSLVASDADALFMQNGRLIRSLMQRTAQLETIPVDMTETLLTRRISLATCTVCLRREPLVKIIEANPWEFSAYFPMLDVQTWWEFSRIGRIHVIQEALATYRVLNSSASHSNDPEKVFEFYSKSLEVHEHYVSKFGYDDTVLSAVRRAHYGKFADLALKSQNELLRVHALTVIHELPRGMPLLDRIMLWGIQTQTRFQLLSMTCPALIFGFRASRKGQRMLKQLFS